MLIHKDLQFYNNNNNSCTKYTMMPYMQFSSPNQLAKDVKSDCTALASQLQKLGTQMHCISTTLSWFLDLHQHQHKMRTGIKNLSCSTDPILLNEFNKKQIQPTQFQNQGCQVSIRNIKQPTHKKGCSSLLSFLSNIMLLIESPIKFKPYYHSTNSKNCMSPFMSLAISHQQAPSLKVRATQPIYFKLQHKRILLGPLIKPIHLNVGSDPRTLNSFSLSRIETGVDGIFFFLIIFFQQLYGNLPYFHG